jgi:hypothetical protein
MFTAASSPMILRLAGKRDSKDTILSGSLWTVDGNKK